MLERMKKIETLLFVSGDEGISAEDLSAFVESTPKEIEDALLALEKSYEDNPASSLHILEINEKYTLTTKGEMAELLKEYAKSPTANALSQSALEVLSIIAYKQPISRVAVDEVRGVGSANAIHRLVQFRLIEAKGRMEAPGRPILYGTTDEFMNTFGLRTMDDLPDIEQMEEEMNAELPVDLFFDRYKDKGIDFEEDEMEEMMAQRQNPEEESSSEVSIDENVQSESEQ